MSYQIQPNNPDGTGGTPYGFTPPPSPAPYTAPAPTTQISPGDNAARQSAKAYLAALLDEYGLGSLAAWANDQIQQGQNVDYVRQQLELTPEFEARFPAIKARAKAGLPPISPSEYISYEQAATQTLRAAGLPKSFWDQPSDFNALLTNDVSINELQNRINNGFLKVSYAPQSVKDAFALYYGASGESALAALFMDPTRAEPLLEQQANAAFAGGYASMAGLNLNEAAASQVARFTNGNLNQMQAGFKHLGTLAPLFDETLGEQGHDFTASEQGIASEFGLDPTAANQLEQRRQQRAAEFQGGGGPQITSTGAALGSATPH